MKQVAIRKVVKELGDLAEKNSPIILTSFAVVGVITTTALAVKATPEALKIIEGEKQKREEELTRIELVKITWKCYIPTAIMGFASIACMIGATSVNLKRNAAIMGLYSLSKETLKEYQDKVKEIVGEKKATEIHDEIMKDQIEHKPYNTDQVILTGKGETLCYDSFSGRYFKSDIEYIRRIQNDLNWTMLSGDMRTSLNDFYYALGLSAIKMGDDYGWDIDRPLELKYSSQLQPESKLPCLVIDYDLDLIKEWI